MTIDGDLRARREALVREHMESENRHEFDVTLGTFGHPRYEIVPTGDVYDGAEEVARYFAESRAAFPDQRNETIALHHADDAVMVEFWLRGTHEGELCGIPPSRSFEPRASNSSRLLTTVLPLGTKNADGLRFGSLPTQPTLRLLHSCW